MYKTCIEAWILQQWGKTNRAKNSVNLIIPMARALTKAIESTLEQPILVRLGFRVPRRWTHDCNFIRWQDSLTKCILAIPLSKWVVFFNS
jgi:hypothetical protein